MKVLNLFCRSHVVFWQHFHHPFWLIWEKKEVHDIFNLNLEEIPSSFTDGSWNIVLPVLGLIISHLTYPKQSVFINGWNAIIIVQIKTLQNLQLVLMEQEEVYLPHSTYLMWDETNQN